MPIDLVVIDEDQFTELGNTPWSVVAEAVAGGKLLYAA